MRTALLPVLKIRGDKVEPRQTVSIVIPSWSGDVRRVRTSLEAQTFHDYSVHVVGGNVRPLARARNRGAAESRGDLIFLLDDDMQFGHDRVLETLVATLRSDPEIGVVGPSRLISPNATWLQRRMAKEKPRTAFPVLDSDRESNPPLDRHGYTGIASACCLVRRSVFDAVGGYDERITRGEDTEFLYRVRKAGYRMVISRGCWVYHDPPRKLSGLLYKSFFYGVGHAEEARKWPERHMDVVPLDRWYGKLFVLLAPLFFFPSLFVNVSFDPVRHLRFGFQPLKALSTYATLYGYTWGWYR
jgi:GT2 family glycosyltransferase